MQRRNQHADAQAQPLRAGCRVRQQLQGRQERRFADSLLQRPASFEARFLCPRQVRPQTRCVEAVAVALRNGDRKPHFTTVRV